MLVWGGLEFEREIEHAFLKANRNVNNNPQKKETLLCEVINVITSKTFRSPNHTIKLLYMVSYYNYISCAQLRP